MEKLKEENRVVLKQYRQLKAKNEKDIAGLSHGAIPDSLETDPAVSVSTCNCVMLFTYRACKKTITFISL